MKPKILHILFVNNTSKLGAGTSQTLCSLIKSLHSYYKLSVVSDCTSQELPQALNKMGISHYALHDRTAIFLPQLIYLVLTRKVNLVYGNGLSGRSKVAFWAAKITKRPFIWHIHESTRQDDKRAKEVHLADRVIANSQDTARRLREYAHVKDPIVIPNGIDLSQFDLEPKACRLQLRNNLGLKEDALIVINLGRICEQKNQLDSIKIAGQVINEKENVHFLFLGSFQNQEYLEYLKKTIQQTSFPARFYFMDHTNDFIPVLMGCDVLLHTSRVESQGRVILEAMAARLPVVAFNIGGVGESIVQGETGFLREFGDLEGMADDLTELFHDKELRLRFGVAGCERVNELFTAERTAEQVRNVIDQVLKNER